VAPTAPSSPAPDRFLGVDVGGTKVAVASVTGGRLGRVQEHATELESTEALLAGLERAVREATEVDGPPRAVGVGVPSMIDFASGTVQASVNIPLEGVPLRKELERRLGMPVFVDNDANCAALGEAGLLGEGRAGHLVMLTLGTGVGGGVIMGGRIFRGSSGLGAELGHVVVEPEGPICPGRCPNRGCLEAFCSGSALARDASELARDRPDTPLGRILAAQGAVSAPDCVKAAREGDPLALELLERLGRFLGVAIAGIVNTFEPEHVVIGGGLSRESDLFLAHARREAELRALPPIIRRVRIALARGGAEAGVLGAALLAADELDEPAGDTPRPTTIQRDRP
jgi:glucokinase